VIAALRFGISELLHDLDLVGIRQTRHISDHSTQVRVGARAAELQRLDVVVLRTTLRFQLEVFPVHTARAAVQLRVLDLPRVEELRMFDVVEVDDREARPVARL
jgi:hypothetical protein